MTEIFCDNDECKHYKEIMIDETTVAHASCVAEAINLYMNNKDNKNSYRCTMFEQKE